MANRRFLNIMMVMLFLFTVAFGSAGCGGGHSSNFTENNPDNPDLPNPSGSYTVTFDSDGGTEIDAQIVEAGNTATQPGDPQKDGNLFIGWYPESGFSFAYDFDTPVNKDITLHAKWYVENDTTDSDGDGLSDSLELTFGTDPYSQDTDDDGLTDYDELNYLNYNPLIEDTNGDGIPDGEEDPDKDGLTNIQEANLGTNMIVSDTDHDGLTDYEEVMNYHTDPLKVDTDGDGVTDGTEIAIGSNPLVAETTFETKFGTNMVASGDREAVDISVIMTSGAESAGTLGVAPATRTDNPLISSQIPGYLNAAYEITSEGTFNSATIEFTLGEDVGTISETFQPRIYYFNKETGLLEELENQTVENRKIIAQVSHFSTYILLNKAEFDLVWSNDIKPPVFDGNENIENATLDIVFVIDGSGSMSWNDPNRLALTLSKNFVEKLRDGKDRAAVVKFGSGATVLQNLTTDKDLLNTAIDRIRYDDGTYIYSGLSAALEILKSSTSGYRYIILLTDGEDGYPYSYYQSFIEEIVTEQIVIYTIGMGDAVEDVLQNIASDTNGKYYRATASTNSEEVENLTDLTEVFEDIEAETIDLTKDENNDGIPDYYAELINNGTLKLSNGTTWLVGVLDMYGNTDDWDGDGLKNGEEISIRNEGNKTYIAMNSDPLLWDTDFDGYGDYDEVKTMKTSPMQVTLPAPYDVSGLSVASAQFYAASSLNGDMKQVKNDSAFNDVFKYLDFSKEEHQMQYFFDWHKTEEAKNALIDYFYKYTNTQALNGTEYRAGIQLVLERTADIIGNVSEIMGTYKAVQNCANTIETLGFQDSTISSNASRANNAAKKKLADLQDAKKFDLATLNTTLKSSAKKLEPLGNLLNTGASDFCKGEAVVKGIEKDITNVAAVEDFLTTVKVTDWSSVNSNIKIESKALSNLTKLISTAANITTNTGTFAKWVFTKNKPLKEWPVIFKNDNFRNFTTRSTVVQNRTDVGKTAALKFTLVTDAVVMAKDVVNVMATYGKVWANVAAYQEYIDLLRYIEEASNAPEYVKNGAHGITVLFNDANDPDWGKFTEEVAKASLTKIAWGVAQMAIDVASNAFPLVKLVNTTYNLAKSTFSILGVTERAKTIVEAQIYYSITNGSSHMLDKLGNFESIYFSVTNSAEKEEATKYLVQLAQSRIVGLNTVMGYITDGGPAGWVDRGSPPWPFGIDEDNQKKEQITRAYETAIEEVYKAVKNWKLTISDKLPYYNNYGK